MMEHIVATYSEQRERKVSREDLTSVWLQIPDAAGGIGMWRFAEPIDAVQSASLFYPMLYQNKLGLAFRNRKWMGEDVQLEFGFVLAWCPAGYVWPYCMLCGKFVFPYMDFPNHRASGQHRRALWRWRNQPVQTTINDALVRSHRYPFFAQGR